MFDEERDPRTAARVTDVGGPAACHGLSRFGEKSGDHWRFTDRSGQLVERNLRGGELRDAVLVPEITQCLRQGVSGSGKPDGLAQAQSHERGPGAAVPSRWKLVQTIGLLPVNWNSGLLRSTFQLC